MEKHKIDRINELARKKKSDGLTDEEAAEHAALRQEYIAGFRENMRQVLENTDHLSIVQGEVTEIMVENGAVKGV